MKANWLRSFAQYLDRQAPRLQVDGYGQSRRISDSGWPYATKEIRCYSAIHYYFERGLGAYEKPITQVLEVIRRFQKDRERGQYRGDFYLFGLTGDTLKNRKHRQLYPHTNMTELGRAICGLSGSEESDLPGVVQVLGLVDNHDFQVFFCRDDSVKLNRNLTRKYIGLRSRCAWFFLEGQEPRWEPGSRFRLGLTEIGQPVSD